MKRRSERREEAQVRQEARDARTDQSQVALLELHGHGHCREAVRLRKRIKEEVA